MSGCCLPIRFIGYGLLLGLTIVPGITESSARKELGTQRATTVQEESGPTAANAVAKPVVKWMYGGGANV